MTDTDTGQMSALLQEVASTKETAQKIANVGPSEGADVPRVLAGLIAHLAEQVERLLSSVSGAGSGEGIGSTDNQGATIDDSQNRPPEDAKDPPRTGSDVG